MLLVQSWSFPRAGCSRLLSHPTSQINNINCKRNLVSPTFACLQVVTHSIAQVAQNKVLIAATICAAVGQLAKPFTAAILYKKGFNPKAAFQAGGFPSTHSSAAMAAAMSLGLERGFSDAIFGLAVVYTGLTMYDAQGVRREVGIHAKKLNNHRWNSFEGDRSLGESSSSSGPVLKESIGHTEIEVIAGALLGFIVSLAIYSV